MPASDAMPADYRQLKLSWELFQKAPQTLSDAESRRLAEVARHQDGIERRILASREAADIVVPTATLQLRVGEIRQRYASTAEFILDLAANGFDESALSTAVERELRVESVLEKVAAATPPVSLIEAENYYRLHPAAFDRPEARRLRHILIACDTPAEHRQAAAHLDALRATVGDAETFAAAALRHSQCPTAMDGGRLGVVKHGQLFAELEPTAFALARGATSAATASPLGQHLLRCDEIMASGMLPFTDVGPRIVERLSDKRRREAQRDWINRLPAGR